MSAAVTTDAAPTRNGNYVDAGGTHTYYEVTGDGDPLVLLHGGMCSAETWDLQVADLSSQFTVYVPERAGHGRTPDVDEPITYESMAEHTIAFMDAVGIDSAHVAGWSDGALVGLLVALRRPNLVRKLGFIEQFVTLDGAVPGYTAFMSTFTAELAPPFLVDAYAALSPDGRDHFATVFEKLHTAWTAPTGVTVDDLTNLRVPTLVLLGDHGTMALEQVADVREAIPDVQIAIVPGASHGLPMEKPHVVNLLLREFFADEQAPMLFAL